jgi:hypothetical protein
LRATSVIPKIAVELSKIDFCVPFGIIYGGCDFGVD